MMSKAVRTLAKPFTVPVAACARSVAAMDEPLKRHIDACEAKGEDVTAAVWKEYIKGQTRLIPFRIAKLKNEVQYIVSGQMAYSDLSTSDFLILVRFITKCFFLFLLGVIVGRGSIYPPLEPSSPFVREVIVNWQPNQVSGLAGSNIILRDQEKFNAFLDEKREK